MPKSAVRSLPSLSVRIDLDPEGRIGPGKIQLLENIKANGSISAAGRAMDMRTSAPGIWSTNQPHLRPCRRRAADRRQEWRRRRPDAVRPVARRALPKDRTRCRQRGPQGTDGVADRYRTPAQGTGSIEHGSLRGDLATKLIEAALGAPVLRFGACGRMRLNITSPRSHFRNSAFDALLVLRSSQPPADEYYSGVVRFHLARRLSILSRVPLLPGKLSHQSTILWLPDSLYGRLVHRARGIERLPHAAADVAIPFRVRPARPPCGLPYRSSAAFVPLLSPRDTNGACDAAIAFNAATLSPPPFTWAGSAEGTMIKSFQAICRRVEPWPSSMNACSAFGS